jgi:hypothetical protein
MSLLVRSSSSSLGAVAAAATAVAASSWYTACQQEQPVALVDDAGDSSFRVEVHLMDKIQQKSYTKDAKEGIPSTLRILAIDLPEMRTDAFSGECRLMHDKVFVDDIAPPKSIPVPGSDKKDAAASKNSKEEKMQIAQKNLVKVRSSSMTDRACTLCGIISHFEEFSHWSIAEAISRNNGSVWSSWKRPLPI